MVGAGGGPQEGGTLVPKDSNILLSHGKRVTTHVIECIP